MIRRLLVVLVGIVVAVLGVPAVASAHTELHESSPADGAQVDKLPGTITLTFGEDIEGPTAQVGVLVGDHDPIQIAAPVDGPTLTIDTTSDELAPLAADAGGKWAIAYTVVGLDGHAIDGTVTFSVAESGAADENGAATSQDADPSSAAAGASEDADATDTDTDETAAASDEDEPMSLLLWLAIVAVIGLVVFAVVKTDRMRRKKAETAAKAATETDARK